MAASARPVSNKERGRPVHLLRLKQEVPFSMPAPIIYLFAGSNGAGKTTFAKAYLTLLDPIPRFLNADEIARGLSPLDPSRISVSAGKLLLHEVDGCLRKGESFGMESTLSGLGHVKLLKRAKSLGYHIELHYLWLPSPSLAISRIKQRVKKGGHHIPDADVRRRYKRSLLNVTNSYLPLTDSWTFRDNTKVTDSLLYQSETSTVDQLKTFLKL